MAAASSPVRMMAGCEAFELAPLSSAMTMSSRPSMRAASPSTMPERIASRVDLPITWRGARTSTMGIKDGFGKLLASGLVFTMAFQIFTVVGGITLVIPLTGLTMPYMAAGGSSLIANYLLSTLLIIVSNAANKPAPEVSTDTFQYEALAVLRDHELKEREAEVAKQEKAAAKAVEAEEAGAEPLPATSDAMETEAIRQGDPGTPGNPGGRILTGGAR